MNQIIFSILSSLSLLISCSTINSEKLELSKPIQNSSYFPKESEDYYGISKYLYELNEPTIFNKKENIEIYRLTSLIEMSGEIDIERIVKIDDDIYLIRKIKKLKSSKSTKTKISLEKFNEFKSKLNSYQIKNFKIHVSNSVDDGIQYVMEINDSQKYYVIFRNNPQTGKGADPIFLEVAKLFNDIKNN